MSKPDLLSKVRLVMQLCADDRLSGDQARVAAVLILHFHNTKNGECFPSHAQLAEAACTTRRTTQRAVDQLEAMGVIGIDRTTGGRQKRNKYRLETVTPAPRLDAETVTPAPRSSDTSATFSGLNGDTSATPLIQEYKKQELNTGIISAREHLEAVLDGEHAQAVIDHRKALRKPLTAYAAKLLAKKFAQCPDPNDAAEAMVGNGWQGFRPEWLAGRNGRGPPGERRSPMMQVMHELLRETQTKGQSDDADDGTNES